jgi:predicted DNA-binding transcriptional regulator AlpA
MATPRSGRPNNDDELLTAPQAAQVAGLNRSHFSRLLAAGQGPKCHRIGSGKKPLVVIRRGDLNRWIAGRTP